MANDPLILVLDEGTTSTRAMVLTLEGRVAALSQQELTQHYPEAGWVEHDAAEIWEKTLACARAAIAHAGGASRIAAIGITNQRETVVAWDKASGQPLSRALVWQDRRTTEACAALRRRGLEADVQAKTGLLLDPYFSATKASWLIENVPDVRDAAASGRLALGTIESWLAFKLTGGLHISDASNASRTLLLPLDAPQWDAGLCDLFGVPLAALGEVTDCSGRFAETLPEWFGSAIPLTGLIGDQQSATIGQGCLFPGDVKATYGTGAFVLANMGARLPRSAHRLLGTVLVQQEGKRRYALEGSVFVAGSLIQWLRDGLGLIASSAESENLARSVSDSAGVVVIPALSGLGAPHWRPEARGVISGLSFASDKAHIVRAALEAMAAQTNDLARAFAADGAAWKSLRIDGGMSANDWVAQDLANLLAIQVERPDMVETTALGAAMLAGVGAGLFATLGEAAAAMRGPTRRFSPAMDEATRAARISAWSKALAAL
jgi:glycerol kinase